MSYEIIEKNQYGVLVRDEKDQFEYYLSALEAEKLETEITPETFTINDMYVESKLLFDCQDELKSLQIENKKLKERIKELEVCQHPYKYLERNENGLFCQKCKTQISSDPNIY